MKLRCLYILLAGLLLATIKLVPPALSNESNNIRAQSTNTAVTLQTSPEDLAKKSGCLKCHGVDKAVIGPAYKDVAARYQGNASARETLIKTVKNGGKGNWTNVTDGGPMPPHGGRLSEADIKILVDWVLSRDDQ
jgi:cytochrome c